ncbi:beta-1,6-N-acetylglucosaminyltransferase [uncultured Mucilaginibacter sp.]|uniref:beta-1,6-N-acetylglucosaminyltransferase n=1 Tax=uncultured Mucilaginibacter sp. TaxID=797541 RepID=UPI0025DD67E8|nr:beta-1,6-N-acetylglucosaminyltransferase [uncultured Mucilaginibacter sp.]
MHQAILITAYKNISHLIDFVNIFRSYDNFHFYIHIDKKSDIDQSEIHNLNACNNIKLISREYVVNWGGINHLKAILLLANEAIKDKRIEYVHAVSGQDFPVKTGTEITSYLTNNKGKEFIVNFELPFHDWPGGGINRVVHYNLYDTFDASSRFQRKIIKLISLVQEKLNIKRALPAGSPKLYGGGTWWTLSKPCLEYVFDYLEQHPQYLKAFNYTFCSEEIFFHTIVLNSPFRENVVNDDLRYIIWELRNGSRPANLDDSDYEPIMSSNKIFARKFGTSSSQKLLQDFKQHLSSSND